MDAEVTRRNGADDESTKVRLGGLGKRFSVKRDPSEEDEGYKCRGGGGRGGGQLNVDDRQLRKATST